jgi:hypothetical protein
LATLRRREENPVCSGAKFQEVVHGHSSVMYAAHGIVEFQGLIKVTDQPLQEQPNI